MNRRHFLGALTLATTLSLAPLALAADKKPFDQKAFEAAQAAGQPILIDVSAPWCPTCKAQAPILARLQAEPRMKSLVAFTIDFDFAEGPAAQIQCAEAEHADRVQGQARRSAARPATPIRVRSRRCSASRSDAR